MSAQFPNENGHTTFGLHFMLDAYGAKVEDLNDLAKVYHFLDSLPAMIGMHKLASPYIVNAEATAGGKDPGGITGFTLIAESHISIHTFGRRGFLTMDLYSCNDFEAEVPTVLDFVMKNFPYEKHELQIVKRGLEYPTFNT